MWRFVIQILSIVLFVIFSVWYWNDRSYEPLAGIVASIIGLISSFLITSDKKNIPQSQTIKNKSTGFQAGGDINIGLGKDNDR